MVMLFAGSTLCMPVPHSPEVAAQYPWWANQIRFGNVLLHEVIFSLYVSLIALRLIVKPFINLNIPGRQAGILLLILAAWCGLVSLTAPLPVHDIGRTLRLLLNVLLFYTTIRWSKKYGSIPIAALLIGFLVGTIINLVISIQFPLIVYGTMRLSGQNTPGVAMGMGIHLCAWLFLRSENQGAKLSLLASSAILLFACTISYSRIGWFIGATGILLWVYILFIAKANSQRSVMSIKKARRTLVPLVIVLSVAFLISPIGEKTFDWIKELAVTKLEQQGESNSIRWAYAIGTLEILSKYPLGVGYSGFYDAMTQTDIYKSGRAAEEVSITEANPHASVLWYATAGGIPGLIVATITFTLLLNTMRVGLKAEFKTAGLISFILISSCYIVIAFTVPYIFNSIILVVPAAIAAGWGWAARGKLAYKNIA